MPSAGPRFSDRPGLIHSANKATDTSSVPARTPPNQPLPLGGVVPTSSSGVCNESWLVRDQLSNAFRRAPFFRSFRAHPNSRLSNRHQLCSCKNATKSTPPDGRGRAKRGGGANFNQPNTHHASQRNPMSNRNPIHDARQLRKHKPDAEALLWSILRGKQLCGLKFSDNIRSHRIFSISPAAKAFGMTLPLASLDPSRGEGLYGTAWRTTRRH